MDVHYTGLGPLYHLTCFLGGVILLLRIPYGLNIGLLVDLYKPEFTGHRTCEGCKIHAFLYHLVRFLLLYVFPVGRIHVRIWVVDVSHIASYVRWSSPGGCLHLQK